MDRTRATNFLGTLFRHCNRGTVEYRLLPSRRQLFIPLSNIRRLPDLPGDQNIYYGVSTRDGNGGGKDNLFEIPALWVDVDFKETSRSELGHKLKCFPLIASAIINSGGGFHLYWFLREQAEEPDISRIERILKQLAFQLSGDMKATDASRILRLPGTMNLKYNPPRPVAICKLDPSLEYTLEDFEEALSKIETDSPIGGESESLDIVRILSGLPEGQRDDFVFKYACSLRARGITQEEAKILIERAWRNCERGNHRFSKEDALGKVEWVYKKYNPGRAKVAAKGLEGYIRQPKGHTAAELMQLDLPEPKWVVPGILPEGLAILAGKPKRGKSWMALGIAVAVATGGEALRSIEVEKGDVLGLFLEDNPRRLQKRLKSVLQGRIPPDNLRLHTFGDWPKLDAGGLVHIENWLKEHPEGRLVVIDTLAKVRPMTHKSSYSYADDYEALEGLKDLADRYAVAILVIHHTRKAEAEDPLDEVSGTTGLTGVVDTIAVLKSGQGRSDAILYVAGRDVEQKELALGFNGEKGLWTYLGDADEYRMGSERQEIIRVLRQSEKPMGPKAVAEALVKKEGSIKHLLRKLHGDGKIRRGDRGKYYV